MNATVTNVPQKKWSDLANKNTEQPVKFEFQRRMGNVLESVCPKQDILFFVYRNTCFYLKLNLTAHPVSYQTILTQALMKMIKRRHENWQAEDVVLEVCEGCRNQDLRLGAGWQKCAISQLWRLKPEIKVSGWLLLKAERKSLFLASPLSSGVCWQSLAFLGWQDASAQPLPQIHRVFSSVHVPAQIFPLKRAPAILKGGPPPMTSFSLNYS